MKKHKTRSKMIHRDMTVSEKIIAFILVVCLCVTSYMVLPISRVSAIQVVGNKRIPETTLQELSGVHLNQLVMSAQVLAPMASENMKQSHARLKDVQFVVESGNVLQIKVEEYPTVAYVEVGDIYYSVLGNGVALEETSGVTDLGALPVLKWYGDMESLEVAVRQLAQVDESIRLHVSEMVYHSEDKLLLTLYMNDGNQIKVNYTDFASKLTYYNSMKNHVSGQKGVFDLTVGAYFTPYK